MTKPLKHLFIFLALVLTFTQAQESADQPPEQAQGQAQTQTQSPEAAADAAVREWLERQPANLAALCQHCHLEHDRADNLRRRREAAISRRAGAIGALAL